METCECDFHKNKMDPKIGLTVSRQVLHINTVYIVYILQTRMHVKMAYLTAHMMSTTAWKTIVRQVV